MTQANERDGLWLEIHDEELSSAELVAEIEQRVAARRATLGAVELVFPTFGFVSEYPQPPKDGRAYNANLYHHLKQANQLPPPTTEPLLASSPATRVPVLGRLWQLVRAQFHGLILFYVNRTVSEQSKLNNHLISVVNELTRVNQAQQAEIDSLRDELRRLREEAS